MARRGFEHAKQTGMLTVAHAIKLTNLSRKIIKQSIELGHIENTFLVPNTREYRIPIKGLIKYCFKNGIPISKEMKEIANNVKDAFDTEECSQNDV